MIKTYDEILRRVAERTIDNDKQLKKQKKQRRVEFVDLYGIPFTAVGDANTPATFYISISPDLIEYMRFQFKIAIQPFVSTVESGTSSAEVVVEDTSLSVSDGKITPNPHSHDTEPHTHNIVSGVTLTHTTSEDFEIKIADVDITPYLMEQHGGKWISGEGLYPTSELEDESDVYDVLDVACLMKAEGLTSEVDALLEPEFKKVEITSDSPFQATLYLYLKYNNTGR